MYIGIVNRLSYCGVIKFKYNIPDPRTEIPTPEVDAFTDGRLGKWKTEMGNEKYSVLTRDYSDRPGYTKDIVSGDAESMRDKLPWVINKDGVEVTRKAIFERWNSGCRITRVDSDGECNIEFRRDYNLFRIDTSVTDGGLKQETKCDLLSASRGGGRLIEGDEKFFREAIILPQTSDFEDHLKSARGGDGLITTERVLSARKISWKGGHHDEYEKVLLESVNGKVSMGRETVGIGFGGRPEMHEVIW